MASYFDIVSGLPGSSHIPNTSRTPKQVNYRYYKCIKNTCNKVKTNDKDTINIPDYLPETLDKYFIRYHLKTFLPISIS